MGFIKNLVTSDEQKKRDAKAREIRDKEMARRKEVADEAAKTRSASVMREVARIAEQTKARKEGRLKP